MNRKTCQLLMLLGLPALLLGCPNGGGGGTDGGKPDGSIEDVVEPIIKVSGTAQLHPAAVAWAADAGAAVPSLIGATARVEEPLKLALNENDPTAVFSSTVLGAGLAFSAPEVPTENVVVGIALGFQDTADAGIYRAASTIWDNKRQGNNKPKLDINNAVAFAMPTSFVAQLSAAIGQTNIQAASENGGSTIATAGFALMRIVDAQGKPVSGAKISFTCPTCQKPVVANQFWYPNDTLTVATGHAAGGSTSANGLIVYINKESIAHQIFVKVDGNTSYPEHSAGAKPGVGLAVEITPQ